MDEDMEETFENEQFLPFKIDLDYEFDASRYFDFTKGESPLEAQEAELWFQQAAGYPPSPFVAKLKLGVDTLREDERRMSSRSNYVEDGQSTSTYSDTDMAPESLLGDKCRGLTFYNHMEKDIPKVMSKNATKTSLMKGSTLMKPTASQLAKQNRPPEGHGSHRFQKTFLQNSDRSLDNLSSVGIQAAKRQKLDGGHLPKIGDKKHHHNLIHKAPKKDGHADSNLVHTKLKITIPREPDLETAHRAHRTRPKHSTDIEEQVKPATYRFKARPLNRKILEAPSLPLLKKSTPRLPEFQEFHLKTSERAMHHSSAASSSFLPCDKSNKIIHKFKAGSMTEHVTTDSKRQNTVDAPMQDGCQLTHRFRARPLNKKIFSNEGDVGVCRNGKREPTVPKDFQIGQRFQHTPPIELFNKLSLTTEPRQNTVHQPKLHRPSRIPTKGSKENTVDSLRQGNRTIHTVGDKTQIFGLKQTQCGGLLNTDAGSRTNMNRSLDIH